MNFMSASILATKLYIPPSRVRAVHRSRLIKRLNEGFHRRLILVSAPAGFGKTTLVVDWIASYPQPAAWLSLDESDNDQVRFLTYLIAALQGIEPSVGTETLQILQSFQSTPIESTLTVLLNEISAIRDDFALVLDDYHLIDTESVNHAVIFLLEHLPPQMHLVMTTREDPNLPLARLRVRDQLTELRAADLRFTPAEAAEFLGQVMNLDLSAEDVAALESRTEGWIAGLQLAALSMRGRDDISPFVQAFAGNNRYILDYLVEEVLQRQPAQTRSFLLQTAILDKLTGALCDAVTGQAGGEKQLAALERGNFFVVPLDEKRRWYRYHHLFADVLAAHLLAEQPGQVKTLHDRASVWYEQNHLPSEAIRHALAAEHFERASGLIERAAPATRQSRQEATLLGWLKALPEEIFRNRPILSIEYVGALLASGLVDGVEARLRDAERWLDVIAGTSIASVSDSAELVIMNQDELHRLPGWIALYRSGYATALGNIADTVSYAQQVLEIVPEDDHLLRGAAKSLMGLAFWTSGQLEAAYQSYADGMAQLQLAGNITDTVGGVLALADIRIAQGRLRDAMRVYERSLQLAVDYSSPTMRGTADMQVGIADLQREYGDLNAARHYLQRSKEQGEHTGFPQNPYRWRVVMARILAAEGDLDGALELLGEAERLYVGDFYPNVRPVAAAKARVLVRQGRLDEALAWAHEHGVSIEDEFNYLHEFEHITLARILLARCQVSSEQSVREITFYLKRLLQAAEAGERTGSSIEILILQALVHQLQGDIPTALVPLERALKLAAPEAYVRMFVDEGAPMLSLLEHMAKRGGESDYVQQLLAAFGKPGVSQPRKQGLSEPLSDREQDVLRLLGTDLSGPEIARELVVSLNTLRTHTKNIYDKLGVNNRRAAVHRAEELGLL